MKSVFLNQPDESTHHAILSQSPSPRHCSAIVQTTMSSSNNDSPACSRSDGPPPYVHRIRPAPQTLPTVLLTNIFQEESAPPRRQRRTTNDSAITSSTPTNDVMPTPPPTRLMPVDPNIAAAAARFMVANSMCRRQRKVSGSIAIIGISPGPRTIINMLLLLTKRHGYLSHGDPAEWHSIIPSRARDSALPGRQCSRRPSPSPP